MIVNPTISNELNESYNITFEFPIPELVQSQYNWVTDSIYGTDGTSFIGYTPNPSFPGFLQGTDGTSFINYVSEIVNGEVLIFKGDKPYTNIEKWTSITDSIIGDTDFLDIRKEFRYSLDNYEWSDWYVLSVENLNTYLTCVSEVYLEFKYYSFSTDLNFDLSIPIVKPKNIGWTKLYSGTDFFKFDRDYPTQGTYGFTIGDYVLTSNDIRFGTTLAGADSIINKDDNIFINPLFQGISLAGTNFLNIDYTEREVGANYLEKIYLQFLSIDADHLLDTTDSLFNLIFIGERKILSPPSLLKVFKFTDYQLSMSGITDQRTVDVQYRYSSNKKKWSKWEYLTNENFSTIKPDSLSFFYIEIAFIRTGTDDTGIIKINDLVFEGDFQNVSADYEKTNRFGLRSDCNYGLTIDDRDHGTDTCEEEIDREWSNGCKPLFNPYEFTKSVKLYDKLASDVSDIVGIEVHYYRTKPDIAGKDLFLHEYGSLTTTDKKDVKVILPEGKFPESLVAVNGIDMALFEPTFELHITKNEFFKKFGKGEVPAQKDFIYFCQVNRWYEVEQSQPYRDFMGSSVYYKVLLKKRQDPSIVDGGEYKEELTDLMKNNSHEALFGNAVADETANVANKDILKNLSEEASRLSIKAPIFDHELDNGPNIISTNYYSFETLVGADAVIYSKIDTEMLEGENRAFTTWFNIRNYVSGQIYNLIDNRSAYTATGYAISFKDGKLVIDLNNQHFEFDVTVNVGTWYGLIVNIEQRTQKLNFCLYKRKSESAPGSATSIALDLVNEETVSFTPISFADDLVLRVYGSAMYYTNMRLFKTNIDKEEHFLLLNQYIVKDMSKMIVCDNANRRVITPSHKF